MKLGNRKLNACRIRTRLAPVLTRDQPLFLFLKREYPRLDVNERNRYTTIIIATTKRVQLTSYCSRRLRGFNFKKIYFFINRCCNYLFGVESKSAVLILQQYRKPVNDYSLGPG